MSAVAVEALLRHIAGLAKRREPLAPGLRASGLPGAATIATRLDHGGDLRQALAAALPGRYADLIAGPHPPLERAALLAAEDARLRRLFRATLFDVIAYPLISLAAMLGAGWYVAFRLHAPIADDWLLAGIPGAALVLQPFIGLAGESLAMRVPMLTGWALHARWAGRYECAALAVRWRLPESDLRTLLGDDLNALAPLLGTAGAEAHCRRLAEHHRRAGDRTTRRMSLAIGVGLHLIAGAVILPAAAGIVGGRTALLLRPGGDVE